MQPPAAVPAGDRRPGATREVVRGDWDDVDAAVSTGVRRCQLAVEDRTEYRLVEGGPVTVVDYQLRAVRGDSGWLRVRRLDGGGEGPGDLEVTCRLGAFGAAGAESCVVGEVESRLRTLLGRDYAPLSDG